MKKNFFYNLILTVSNVLFPIITFPYAARILGPEGIGKVQFATNLVQYFILLAALGIPIYGIREISKAKNKDNELKKVFTTLFILNLLTSIVLFIAYLTIVFFTEKFSTDKSFYSIAGLMLILSFCNVDWFFSGLERFKFIAVRSVIVKAIFLFILFYLVKNKTDDTNYLWVIVGAAVLNNLLNIYHARDFLVFKLFVFGNIREHLKPLLYIFGTVVAASIYSSLDTVLLGFVKGFKDVGYYTAASRINKMVIPFLTSLSMVMMPQMAQAFKENNINRIKELLDASFDFVIVLGVPMTIGLIALAPELIILLSGEAFEPAILSMQIMAPVVLIIGLSTVWAVGIIIPAAKDKQASLSVFFGLLISLILNLVLIPKLSYLGATIANLSAELVVMCCFAYFASKVVKNNFNFKNILLTISISLLFFPIVILIRSVFERNNIVICLLSIVGCSVIYFILQIFVFNHKMLKLEVTKLTNKIRLK